MEEILACRICLATDVKLFDMFKYRLKTAFENVTGLNLLVKDDLPHQLCSICSTLVLKFTTFKEKCRRSQELLEFTIMEHLLVTTDIIRNIDRKSQYPAIHLTTHHTHPVSLTIPPTTQIKEEDPWNEINSVLHHNEISHHNEIFNHYEMSRQDDISYDNGISDCNSNHSDEEPLSKKVKKRKRRKKKDKVHFDDISIKSENDDAYYDTKEAMGSLENDIELVVLTKEQQIEEVLLRKDSFNYQNSIYKCEQCFKGFITDVTYKNHMLRHDPASGKETCDICHTRWPDIRSLRSHILISHERKYICKLCNHISKSNHKAKEHAKWHNGFRYICKICGGSFAKSTSYLTHVRLQHPSKNCCDVCGESFIGETGLNMHKKRAHPGEKPKCKAQFDCNICGVQFNSAEALKTHLDAVVEGFCDTNLRPCEQCGHSFGNNESLKEHLEVHHKRNAVRTCNECNRTFACKRSFAVHYQRVHLGVKMKYRKPEMRLKAVVVCEICGKKCKSKSTLVYHQRTHTGEKPYQCTECPKRFSVYQRLQIHLRTHTGERPFKCARCPKAFKHKAALNRHDRVHSGAKPYVCPHCSKSFSQSNSMKIHVNTVHLKLPAPYRARRNVKLNEIP